MVDCGSGVWCGAVAGPHSLLRGNNACTPSHSLTHSLTLFSTVQESEPCHPPRQTLPSTYSLTHSRAVVFPSASTPLTPLTHSLTHTLTHVGQDPVRAHQAAARGGGPRGDGGAQERRDLQGAAGRGGGHHERAAVGR